MDFLNMYMNKVNLQNLIMHLPRKISEFCKCLTSIMLKFNIGPTSCDQIMFNLYAFTIYRNEHLPKMQFLPTMKGQTSHFIKTLSFKRRVFYSQELYAIICKI